MSVQFVSVAFTEHVILLHSHSSAIQCNLGIVIMLC